MLNKFKKITGYLLYILYSNIIFGFILYYTFTWLVGYSPLYAYLGNLAFIILGLILDEYVIKVLVRDLQLKKRAKKSEKVLIISLLSSYISFKTVLYLFYIFILIISQIIKFYPDLLNEALGNFISANTYSILLLMSIDKIILQFIKDRSKMNEILEKFKDYLNEE